MGPDCPFAMLHAFVSSWLVLATLGSSILAAPSSRSLLPTVTLDQGTFVGVTDGTVDQYLGIPFAQPP